MATGGPDPKAEIYKYFWRRPVRNIWVFVDHIVSYPTSQFCHSMKVYIDSK